MKKYICVIIVLVFIVINSSCKNLNTKSVSKTESSTTNSNIKDTQSITTEVYVEMIRHNRLNSYKNNKYKKITDSIAFVENMIINLLNYNSAVEGKDMIIFYDGVENYCTKYTGRFDTFDKLYEYMKPYCSKKALKVLLNKDHYMVVDGNIYSDGASDWSAYEYYYESDMKIEYEDSKKLVVSIVRHTEDPKNYYDKSLDFTREFRYKLKKNGKNRMIITDILEIEGKDRIAYPVQGGW